MDIPRLTPDIRLYGVVGPEMLAELPPNGGDADLGRRIAQELRLWQEKDGRELWFLGKTYLFSAGAI